MLEQDDTPVKDIQPRSMRTYLPSDAPELAVLSPEQLSEINYGSTLYYLRKDLHIFVPKQSIPKGRNWRTASYTPDNTHPFILSTASGKHLHHSTVAIVALGNMEDQVKLCDIIDKAVSKLKIPACIGIDRRKDMSITYRTNDYWLMLLGVYYSKLFKPFIEEKQGFKSQKVQDSRTSMPVEALNEAFHQVSIIHRYNHEPLQFNGKNGPEWVLQILRYYNELRKGKRHLTFSR